MSYQKGLMSLSKGAPVPYDSTFRIVTHDGGRALLQESQQTRKHPVRRRRRPPRRGGAHERVRGADVLLSPAPRARAGGGPQGYIRNEFGGFFTS